MSNFITKLFKKESAKVDPPPNFTGETATGVDDLYHKWNVGQFNPDMLAARKGGLSIYKTMREDDQIKACLQLKKAAIVTPGWDIEGGKQEHIDFLKYVFAQMEGTVEGFIMSMLSAFDYGFSTHEKIFMYIDRGKYEGKIGLKNLKAKSPTRITFRPDEYGNLRSDGIIQKQSDGKETVLPQDKMILYSYQREFDNYYGESDLKSVYRLWFVKTNVLKYWAIYLERFSIPIVQGKLSAGKVTDTQREDFKKLVSNIQAGMSVVTPQELVLDLLESSRVDRGVFDQAIDALNVGIARGILIPQLVGLVPQHGVGSYGKSETDLKVFDWVLGSIGKQVQDIINEQLIVQLIDINYGEQEEYPKFVIKPLKEEDKSRMVAAWSEAVARGAVTTTPETQQFIRNLLSFPEATPEEVKAMEKARDLNLDLFPSAPTQSGDSGISGGNPSGGSGKMSNVPGKANQYSISRTLPGPEARVNWYKVEEDLNKVEWASQRELTDAFQSAISAVILDAKKNFRIQKK
jgi:phage gp29-like protein